MRPNLCRGHPLFAGLNHYGNQRKIPVYGTKRTLHRSIVQIAYAHEQNPFDYVPSGAMQKGRYGTSRMHW